MIGSSFDLTEFLHTGKPPEKKSRKIIIPDSELIITAARSSGPGGQKVNKTSSKALLRWYPATSTTINEEQRTTIIADAGNRLKEGGYIQIAVQSEKSWHQNRAIAIEMLNEFLNDICTPQKERRAGKPTLGSQKRRIADKEHHARKKSARKWKQDE